MSKPDWTPERAAVESIAKRYREKGYQVTVEPGPADVPDFIREYRPDLIARNEKESLIIEVKNASTAPDRSRLQAIAKRVEGQPGWRFVVVSPPALGDSTSLVRALSLEQIHELIQEAESLTRLNYDRAALIVAWSALEGAMRLAAQRQGIITERSDQWTLMRELASNGVLTGEDFTELNGIYRIRSSVAHGFEPLNKVQLSEISAKLLRVTQQLLG